jgi:RNA polymerase sigma-70 factor (ECF subfamily)
MNEDDELLERVHQFEEQALVEVYDRFSLGIYRYSWRILGDEHLAEDCVSETFKRFLQAIRRHNGPRKHLQAYLYRSAHNWITDYYRRRRPEDPIHEAYVCQDSRSDPHENLENSQESQRLRHALAHLTPDQRQVIVLKFVENWENSQIAHALQRPVGAVKSLQHRALARLRKVLEGDKSE